MVYTCKLAVYSGLQVSVKYLVLDPNCIMICLCVICCKPAVYTCKLADYTCKVLNSRFTTVLLISLLDTVEVTPFFQFFCKAVVYMCKWVVYTCKLPLYCNPLVYNLQSAGLRKTTCWGDSNFFWFVYFSLLVKSYNSWGIISIALSQYTCHKRVHISFTN